MEYGDICIHIAGSLCYAAETNKHNNVKQLYFNKDVKNNNNNKYVPLNNATNSNIQTKENQGRFFSGRKEPAIRLADPFFHESFLVVSLIPLQMVTKNELLALGQATSKAGAGAMEQTSGGTGEAHHQCSLVQWSQPLEEIVQSCKTWQIVPEGWVC